MSTSVTNIFVGVDIGGGHIGIGFVDKDNTLICKKEVSLPNGTFLPNYAVDIIINAIKELKSTHFVISKSNNNKVIVRGLGVGCPGQCKNGILVAASNLPGWKNVPLCNMILDQLLIMEKNENFIKDNRHIPVILLNDADAAISAELWGESRELYASHDNAAMITLGTGIGVGLVLNGKLYQGSNGLIEGGHMIVCGGVDDNISRRKCGCGQIGCVEAYSSASSCAKIYKELSNNNNNLGSKDVFDLASNGDKIAEKVINEISEKLALLCINICRVVDPDIIIFGGGMAMAGNKLIDLIQHHISIRTWTCLPTDVKLMIGKSVSNVGIIGAALAAKNSSTSLSSSLSSTSLINIEKKTYLTKNMSMILSTVAITSSALLGTFMLLSSSSKIERNNIISKIIGFQSILLATHVGLTTLSNIKAN